MFAWRCVWEAGSPFATTPPCPNGPFSELCRSDTPTARALLLGCSPHNSRITVGKHNQDLKQEGRTDGGKHYTYTSVHTNAHTAATDRLTRAHEQTNPHQTANALIGSEARARRTRVDPRLTRSLFRNSLPCHRLQLHLLIGAWVFACVCVCVFTICSCHFAGCKAPSATRDMSQLRHMWASSQLHVSSDCLMGHGRTTHATDGTRTGSFCPWCYFKRKRLEKSSLGPLIWLI